MESETAGYGSYDLQVAIDVAVGLEVYCLITYCICGLRALALGCGRASLDLVYRCVGLGFGRTEKFCKVVFEFYSLKISGSASPV